MSGVAVAPAPTAVAFADSYIDPIAIHAATGVLESGWVTTGPETLKFESELASLVGAEHGVGVSSCTAAIELSLRAMRLPQGARVLVSTMTFCGAVHAVVHAGLRPVLVDVDPTSGMPGPDQVQRAVVAAGGVEAMLVVHLGGAAADVPALAAAAGLPLDRVVEDAAHALGTYVGDRHVGWASRATCFSFYATKNLPLGEGGMVTTDDAELAADVRRLRLHGMSADAWRRYLPGGSWRYTVEEPGLKANLTDVQAAIGRGQLCRFASWQQRRAEIASTYDALLSSVPGLELPATPAGTTHAWHLYVVRVTDEFPVDRDHVVDALAERGIGTSVHFIPLHTMPYFRPFADAPSYDGADQLFPQILSLPLYPRLTDAEIRQVCSALSDLALLPRVARGTA